MKLHAVKPHVKNGRKRGRALRPGRWLCPVMVLVALMLLTALGARRGYALEGCARQKFTAMPVMDAYSPNHLCQGEKPLGRLGDDDDDDDGDDGTPI